jgi:small subunit ribosomal protein S15
MVVKQLISMAKTQLDKTSVIADYKNHDTDTGSPDVQIALLTQRINHLTDHLRTHRKDFHSRRGLIAMTSRRRKLLDYVKRHDLDRYKQLLERLKLRR